MKSLKLMFSIFLGESEIYSIIYLVEILIGNDGEELIEFEGLDKMELESNFSDNEEYVNFVLG